MSEPVRVVCRDCLVVDDPPLIAVDPV